MMRMVRMRSRSRKVVRGNWGRYRLAAAETRTVSGGGGGGAQAGQSIVVVVEEEEVVEEFRVG